jgi:SOS-response transcriptional repressor LexA
MDKIDFSKQYVTVISDSMFDPFDPRTLMAGDYLKIDTERTPKDGDFVIAESGEFSGLRKLVIQDGKRLLKFVNPAWPGVVEVDGDVTIVGVVSMVSRNIECAPDAEEAAELEVSHG